MPASRDELERFLAEVPWKRIRHWYGRADDVPAAIRKLRSRSKSARDAAVKLIATKTEHQDGVMQATPFVVSALMLEVADPEFPPRAAVLASLMRPLRAAHFMLSNRVPTRLPSLLDLLEEDCLLPKRRLADEDESLFAEYPGPEWMWLGTAYVTRQVYRDRTELLEAVVQQAGEEEDAARALLQEVRSPVRKQKC